MNSLLILNYHGIQVRGDEYATSSAEREYFISTKSFRAQLEILRKEKFEMLNILSFPRKRESKVLGSPVKPGNDKAQRRVMITLDDGHVSNYEHAFPLLKEFGMKAIFFIPVNLVGTPGYMDWAQIKELETNGFDIGSHGLNHIPLTRLGSEQLKEELAGSKKALEDRLGKAVESFSVPRGFYSARVRYAAREAGYRYVFTSRFGMNAPAADPLALARMAVKTDTGEREFSNWIYGNFGLKGFMEEIKDRVRSSVPPELYDFAASLKR